MKHTLKAKYAADGLSAHRQRIEATQPAVVARRRRQAVVDAVSARFAESARPKVDANDVFTQATTASFGRANRRDLSKWFAAITNQAMLTALRNTKPRDHDDQLDAIKYAYMAAPRSAGKFLPAAIILDDIAC